jgi:ubiquitin-protein ligase E3 A
VCRFNACSLEGEEQFMLLGLTLGLAIYNRVLLDFPLPLPLYKKLLGQAVGLRDLEEMQPRLGRSLRQLLQYEGPASVEVGPGWQVLSEGLRGTWEFVGDAATGAAWSCVGGMG